MEKIFFTPKSKTYDILMSMNYSFISISLLVALTATMSSLLFGLFSLFKGGDFNRAYGNRAMQWRVFFQAVTIILFTVMLMIGK